MTRGILGTTVRLGSRQVNDQDGSRRVADADEDIVTLSVAALEAHLGNNGLDADAIGELFLVGPFDDTSTDNMLSALGRSDVPVSRFTDSAANAMDAVLVAHDRDADAATFVVAATDGRGTHDAPQDWGAAAGVVVVGPGADITLVDQAHQRSSTGPANARAHSHKVLERLGGLGDDAVTLAPVLQRQRDLGGIVPAGVAGSVTAAPVERLGALGCAAPLVALAHGLAARQERPLVWWMADAHGAIGARFSPGRTAHGSGIVDQAAGAALPISAAAASRAQGAWRSGGNTAQGAFVSLQAYLAQAPARHRWIGQRCTSCDQVVFPPRECCPACGGFDLGEHPLSGAGTVFARTRIGTGGAPTEFSPLQDATGPYDVAIVALSEGPRVAAMCTASAQAPAIGDPVRLELRLLYVQDGIPRYGFKAVAAPGSLER